MCVGIRILLTPLLKILSSEMDMAESDFDRYVFLEGSSAEIFRKIHPLPLPLRDL
jgi:hypothetical protein